LDDIIVTTTENLQGYKIVKVLGIVSGSTVRAKHLGKDILASLRHIAGGEVKEYTELLAQAREIALERMKEKARKLGANAVICFRFSTSSIAGGLAEILAYGTAVIAEKEQ